MKIRGIVTTTVLILALIIISTTTAAATSCDCGDICVNQSGWWRDGGTLNASTTPMQAALDNATAGETICAPEESYYETSDIEIPNLMLKSEAAADTDATQTELPEGVSTDWWTAVQEDISKSEYDVTWQETQLPDINAAYQAPNRAHNLRTYFEPENIWITPRTSTDWVFGLSLVGYGFADDMAPVPGAEMSVSENGVEYQRGCLTEWYVNSEDGLEQGFTIDAPPESESQSGQETWIAIEMDILGDLDANMNSASDAIELTTTGGVGVLSYGKLHASDAAGRELDARFALLRSGIEILVNTSGAVYPITIDPLAQSPAWTAESNQGGAQFGWSVASAGDVNGDGYSDVIVGACYYDNGETDEGRAYIYHGSAAGLSTSFAWTAESNQNYASFGNSVASAGDVNGDGYSDVIVGADYYDNGQTDEGRAYVYHGSAAGLSTSFAWTAESNQTDALFGCSVASAGDVNGDGYSDVIVGAYNYDNGETDEGRAYIYHGSAAGLSTSFAWTAESNQSYASFGYSVASAGDVNGDGYSDVIVGAQYYDNGETDEGRAYIYHGSAAGLSTSFAWTAESNQNYAFFGVSVANAGDVNGDGYSDVIVGAYEYDNGEINEGRAYVYHGSVTGLSTSYAWTAESNKSGAFFGWSVASAGDVNGDGYSDVIVGAQYYDNGETDEGRAYIYHGSAAGLSTSFAWTAESNQSYASFGNSVASAGDVNGDGYCDVIVGADNYDNGETDEGRAYVYHGSATGLSTSSAWTAESNQVEAYFGRSVASAGDVNGDGYSDVIVGAQYYDNDEINEGRAYVYHGSATGLSTSFAWTAESNKSGASFGWSVASAGDVNGDGYSDVIVGASHYGNGENMEGGAFVYHGSATGLSTSSAWTAESNQYAAYFGHSVASAGDVNGDGYSDVIVGAYCYDNGETGEGRAYVYHGSATGLSTSSAWATESNQRSAWFGHSVASAGDVNGDGYSDVIVGASHYDNGETGEGRAYVYHGSATGLSTSSAWTAESNQYAAYFGHSVASAGDVNGDGYSDVIVGASHYDNGEDMEERAYVYHGSVTGLSTSFAWAAEGNQNRASFGYSVASAGDVNGDGYSDVIVGAHGYDNVETEEGQAFVYHGSATGLSTSFAWAAEGNQTDAHFGWSVASAGDVNGDGYSDVIVGAHGYDNGETEEGQAFVYHGNGGSGLSLIPAQRKSDNSAPIAHLGRSDSMHEFRLTALGRTPYGRSKVKLEWEVKPLGTPFDGTGTQKSASWTDTGTAGADLNELVSSLTEDTCYHWRMRILYHPVSTPFQPHSRWFSQPWNGWQEADLRTLTENYVPPDPTNLVNTLGNYWVNYTWSAGTGGCVTDSYNVSLNGVWNNGTTNTFMNTTVGPSGWANITIFAYDASGTGTLSAGSVSDSVQAPAAPTFPCTCGDICVDETGWWRDDGAFTASSTPIQAAVNVATAGEMICVAASSYTENVDITTAHLTLAGEGAGVVTVTAASSSNYVFEVTADYVNISGFTATGATGYSRAGIRLSGADNCNISENNASLNNFYGIHLYDSSNNTLTNNNANSNNFCGIKLGSSSNNTITSNNASLNGYYGIHLYDSSNNTLLNNTMSGNVYNFYVYSDSLSEYNQNIDTSNTVDGKPIYYWVDQKDRQIPSDAGFVGVVNGTNVTVRDLTVTNNSHGVLFACTENSRIENVTANSNNHGIYLHDSSNNTITSNNANSNSGVGWGHGINLHESSNNTLASNNASSNNCFGILLYKSSNNTLTGNNASSNNLEGIFLYMSSNDNLIYNNYFDNAGHAYDGGHNTWNITKTAGTNIVGGSWLGGNYWSDYAGNDTDGDGLGDTLTPYNSGIQNDGDYHPLVMFDNTPPPSIMYLHNITHARTYINWTWTNPSDPEFNHTELYLNGTFLANIPTPQNYYNATGLLPDTSYELGTRTVDTSGNINLTWVNDTASTLPASGTTLCLYTGWNLISLPLMSEDTSITSLLSPINGNYSIIWEYNASDTSDHWKKYDPDAPFGNDLINMEPRKGYWIMMISDDTLPISGTVQESTDIYLKTDWNLIGYNFPDSQPVAEALSSISGNYTIVWAYDASDTSDHWKKYDPDAPFGNDLTDMEPGKGYWIMMTSDDILET